MQWDNAAYDTDAAYATRRVRVTNSRALTLVHALPELNWDAADPSQPTVPFHELAYVLAPACYIRDPPTVADS